MMKVREIMQTEVATLQVSDHLDLADDVMRLGRIRHMPVEDDGRVVGVLSQRDLYRAGISSVLQFRSATEREWLAKIVVEEVMTSPVTTVGPGDNVRQLAQVMVEAKIGCVPVVENEVLVGLVSESDLLRHLVELLPDS